MTPVKRFASKTDLIKMSIKSSALFKELEVIRLNKNMRTLPEEQEFANYLLRLGNGELQDDEEADMTLPNRVISNSDLVDEILGECIRNRDYSSLAERVILCTTNDACKQINEQVLPLVPREAHTYYSADAVDSNEPKSAIEYPMNFFTLLKPQGSLRTSLVLRITCRCCYYVTCT